MASQLSKVLALIFLTLLTLCPVSAATFYVDQLTDDDGDCTPGACSLREAALAANALPGVDILELIPGVHELTIPGINEAHGRTGDINFREPVEIRGSRLGLTVIDGNGIDGIAEFFPFINNLELYRLSDLTFTGGNRSAHRGGALAARGARLLIEKCIFVGNSAITGGAVYLSNVDTVIRNSTFYANNAHGGGAIHRATIVIPYGLLIENSTISGNVGSYGSTLISSGEGTLTIRSSTLVNNVAASGASLHFEQVRPTDLIVESSILEGTCAWAGFAPPTSLGGNLFSPNNFCNFEHPTDQTVEDFGLGPLEASDNGFSHPLLPGSPAIDAGASCPPHDQRGAHRPQDGDGDGVALCDAGATELGTPNGLADVPVLPRASLWLLAAFLALVALRRL